MKFELSQNPSVSFFFIAEISKFNGNLKSEFIVTPLFDNEDDVPSGFIILDSSFERFSNAFKTSDGTFSGSYSSGV